MTAIRSVQNPSGSLNERRVLVATGSTSAPSDATSPRFNLGTGDWLHLYCKLTTSTAVTIAVYYWSTIAAAWFHAQDVSFDATLGYAASIEHRGQEAVGFTVSSLTGAGSVELWAGYSHDGKEA